MDFTDVGHTPRHVFKALFVSTIIGDMDDLRPAVRHLLHQLRQVIHRNLLCAPNVKYLADSGRMMSQIRKSAHHIPNIAEGTRLLTIAINCDGLTADGLLNKIWNHHAISTGLSRTDSVEQADDDHRQTLLVPVGNRQEFID